MTPKRWHRVKEILHAAVGHAPEARSAFLDSVCSGDSELRRQVELLAANEEQAFGVLETRGSARDLTDATGRELTAEDLETRTMVAAGAMLGPYQIAGPLGEGGMGKVYRALDTRLGRAVAVKISAEQFGKRFELEARAISALNHPNICTLYDVGSLPSGAVYMVTELVEGETLRQWLKRSPSLERSLGVIRQVIEALRTAHEAGIIHRDLKSANIMVRFDGYVKVLDFGLAKRIPGATRDGDPVIGDLSAPGQIMGTVAYMSPEQILGRDVDARSDLFALGIVLYEMVAGRHPFRKSAVETMHAILHDDPPPIAAPAAIERILRRCLEKQPDLRFQTMAELGTAFQRLQAEHDSTPGARQPSIAVLPFANMSAEKEGEYFGDGLAEEIITALANPPGIKVAARTFSFFFRGKDIEIGEIGKKLHVEHILEGSIRKAGNRIRITAQLIKLSDGFHLWSERFDREMTDIFAIQDEITQAIAGTLRIKLATEGATLQPHAPNLRAYEAYIKARNLWFNGARPEVLPQYKELLERAIELDPRFALPHSFLGMYYTMQANLFLSPEREVIPLAQAAEEEALRVDPTLPEAHALMAVCIGGYEYDRNKAERHWRLAMTREPVSRDVLFWYGNHFLLPLGRTLEAADAMSRGLEGDPLNLLYRHLYARGLRLAGKIAEADAELRSILEIDENYPLHWVRSVPSARNKDGLKKR